jgi:TonB family protein
MVQQPFDFSIVNPRRVEYGNAIVQVDGVTGRIPRGRKLGSESNGTKRTPGGRNESMPFDSDPNHRSNGDVVVMSRCWLPVVLLSVAAPAAHGQTVVAGRVIDRAKRVVLDKVAVELLGARDSVLTTGQTGADGTFTLMAPSGGTYRVRLTAPGSDSHVSDSLRVAEGEYFAREFAIELAPRAFFEFQVTKPVVPAPGSVAPRYPVDLRRAGVAGCVLVQFVVDTTGRADRTTLKLLAYSDREFVQSIWDALPAMRFIPAELGGRKVRQIVQQPFTFSMAGDDPMECRPAPRKP